MFVHILLRSWLLKIRDSFKLLGSGHLMAKFQNLNKWPVGERLKDQVWFRPNPVWLKGRFLGLNRIFLSNCRRIQGCNQALAHASTPAKHHRRTVELTTPPRAEHARQLHNKTSEEQTSSEIRTLKQKCLEMDIYQDWNERGGMNLQPLNCSKGFWFPTWKHAEKLLPLKV